MSGLQAILLDIEGTITPISFVHDVLFPFAKTNLRKFLEYHSDDVAVLADLDLLKTELESDLEFKKTLAKVDSPALVDYIEWLIDADRKSRGLKSLQGKIWEEGYRSELLRAPLFPDVAPTLIRWNDEGISLAIFSSGSVLAQRLLLAHTNEGDLTHIVKRYFDTNTGMKSDANSYRLIAQAISFAPSDVLFISDVVSELDAARAAGMKTLLAVRPGNQPIHSPCAHPSIHSLSEVDDVP